MTERTERLKAVIIDLLHNADANHDGTGEWRKSMSPEELATDMIAYADHAFEPFIEGAGTKEFFGHQEPDWTALEREIVAALKELPR